MKNKISTSIVMFMESATASPYEQTLIFNVIKNRINHIGFDNKGLKSMADVVNQPRAFSCIGDEQNHYWKLYKICNYDYTEFKFELTNEEKDILQRIMYIISEDMVIPYFDAVYYHDKSINMPSNWDNKWWKPKLIDTTNLFKFYSIHPK